MGIKVMPLAPVTLFVYNRPWHTRQTVEALQKNELAAESDLFIYADGIKKPVHEDGVREVRDYIRTISGFRSVTLVERDENWGLARSIITGVTETVKRFGRIIVLEDDLLTSPYFLRYMNEALELYQHEERVISIHGYSFPVYGVLPDFFFLKGTGCWGWATWKRGWDLFEADGEKLLHEIIDRKLQKKFDMNGSYPYTRMLKDQIQGNNNSWAVRWHASAFLKDRLTLHFAKTLTCNFGHDGSGTHCGLSDHFHQEVAQQYMPIETCNIAESAQALKLMTNYYKATGPSFIRKLISASRRRFNSFLTD